MAKMVFIREINPNTYLHFATAGEAFCLRDYSRLPVREVLRQKDMFKGKKYTASEIKVMAYKDGNDIQNAPAVPFQNERFWHEHTKELNKTLPGSVPPPPPPPPPSSKLVERFRQEVIPLIEAQNVEQLKSVLTDWTKKFQSIEDKSGTFNHWCDESCENLRDRRTGKGWLAYLLEYSRQGRQLHYIQTADPNFDFSVLSIELNLDISSKNNPFQPGKIDAIKPDALAVRQDGSAVVLEIKARGDNPDILNGILQAFCGLLAVYAKRQNLTQIARRHAQRRPSAPQFHIPTDEPSMGVYVLIGNPIGEMKVLRKQCQTLLQAFRQLKDIVLFVVDTKDERFPQCIEYDNCFTGNR